MTLTSSVHVVHQQRALSGDRRRWTVCRAVVVVVVVVVNCSSNELLHQLRTQFDSFGKELRPVWQRHNGKSDWASWAAEQIRHAAADTVVRPTRIHAVDDTQPRQLKNICNLYTHTRESPSRATRSIGWRWSPFPQPDTGLHCETATSTSRGVPAYVPAIARPSYRWYALCLPTKGGPGWVEVGGWSHTEMVYSSIPTHATVTQGLEKFLGFRLRSSETVAYRDGAGFF